MADDDDDTGDDTGDDDDSPITRRELTALTGRLDELQTAQQELRSSSTPAERREAKGEVDDAEDAFTRAAKAAGMDRADIVKAVQAAKDEREYGSFKRLMDRYLSELDTDDDDKPASKRSAAKRSTTKPAAGRSQGDQSTGDNPQNGDSAPTKPHWSDRRVSDLVK